MSEEQRNRLERLAEFVLPGEGWTAAGFVERVLTEDRPDWVGRVSRALVDDAGVDRAWLVRLIAQGFYADPSTWETVGWRSGEFAPVQTELRVTPRDELAERYDVVVVGSGAGGGAAAQVLAESGRSVLVVELGSLPVDGVVGARPSAESAVRRGSAGDDGSGPGGAAAGVGGGRCAE